MTDDQIAATLAAAIVAGMGSDIQKLKGTAAQNAVDIFYQCSEALAAKKKTKGSSPRIG